MVAMKNKYFGTDGIRGGVGEHPITADFMLHLGRAAGVVLANGGSRSVVIGKDTRISGYMFESALEAGLAAAGANVALLGPMPTPGVAYLTRTLNACAGRYIVFCKSTMPFEISLRGLKIVVDCANGATYRVAPAVMEELGAQVISIGTEPDGLNINAACGSTSPEYLSKAVLEHNADLGVALDGDGDRVIMVDANGDVVNGDELLYLVAVARQDDSLLQGGVVGTVMSNFGMELALKKRGIPFLRAPVGDRHVHRLMVDKGWTIGGEASGHLLFLDRASTGDGIVSALQVLEVMVDKGRTLAELTKDIQKLPQVMINVPIAGQVPGLEDSVTINAAIDSAETELGETGRVILRPSGTEPLIRVTVEGMDGDLVQRLASDLAEVVKTELGASE